MTHSLECNKIPNLSLRCRLSSSYWRCSSFEINISNCLVQDKSSQCHNTCLSCQKCNGFYPSNNTCKPGCCGIDLRDSQAHELSINTEGDCVSLNICLSAPSSLYSHPQSRLVWDRFYWHLPGRFYLMHFKTKNSFVSDVEILKLVDKSISPFRVGGPEPAGGRLPSYLFSVGPRSRTYACPGTCQCYIISSK